MKSKIKSRGDEVADFYDKEIPKVDFNHTCSAIICFDSALDKDEKYYPEVFLKECKCIKQEGIMHIIDDLESSSNHSVE